MPDDRAVALRTIVDQTYPIADQAVLRQQVDTWREQRPLAGARVLDATPVFHNTLAKYVPLLTAGADLTVCLSPLLPHDPTTARLLEQIGIPVVEVSDSTTECDVVLDCAGALAAVPSRAGYVELTKSGQSAYEGSAKAVFLADDSRVKLIETSLGTGDGFIRGLAHFGHTDLSGRPLVLFGCGKVGRGAAWRAQMAGAHVTLIDPDPHVRPPSGCALVSAEDQDAVRMLISHAWCVASATGRPGALSPLTESLAPSGAVLANLGAEDEFGPQMPAARVLNHKAPVNFALAEPTRLRYLDATFALHNACAVELLTGRPPAGINRPPRTVEDAILTIARTRSAISGELSAMEEEWR